MNISKKIAHYLEDEGIGTLGTDLFINNIPEDKDNALMLSAVPSGVQEPYYKIYNQNIEVWSRNQDTEAGFNKLEEVFDLLHQADHFETDNIYIYFSYAIDSLDSYGRDDNDRALHKTIFNVIYREII